MRSKSVEMASIMNNSFRRYLTTSSVRAAKGVEGASAVSGVHEGGWKIWRTLTFVVALPSIVLCAANCVIEHNKHVGHRPEFVKYDYLRMRSKRFPWGDGNHSFIHNPALNPLPDGYEE